MESKKTEPGIKYDTDKLRWDLLPIECIEDCVKILTFGAGKYGPDNWKTLDNFEDRYYAALMRHLTSWRKGERVDDESGLPSMAHVLCNVVFLLWKDKQE